MVGRLSLRRLRQTRLHGTDLLKISAAVVPEHPGNHLGTARLLLAASFDRPLLYSLVGLLRNVDDDEEG